MSFRSHIAAGSATTVVLLIWLINYQIASVRSQITFSCLDESWSLLPVPNAYTCYKAFAASLEFQDADAQCSLHGGFLVNPLNRVENDYIGSLAESVGLNTWWMALSQDVNGIDPGSDWYEAMRHNDLNRREAHSYYWAAGQPRNDSIALYVSGKIADTPSYPYKYGHEHAYSREKRGFVCERRACLASQVTCFSGECVTGTACDSVSDCTDGSDELMCDDNCYYYQEGESGDVTSDNPYVDGKTCLWTIAAPVGTQVKLEFLTLDTELNHDEISIWIGGPTQTASTLIKRISGNVVPDMAFYSTNNFMVVSFSADSAVSASGFSATWTAEPLLSVDIEELSEENNTVISPDYPLFLVGGIRKSWTITRGRQRTLQTLSVTDLMLGPGAYIEVIDGTSSSGPVLDTFEYGQMNSLFVQSVSNAMHIYLRTEDFLSGASFTFVIAEGCFISLSADQGFITSPGFKGGLKYPNYQMCTYDVQSENGMGMRAIINSFTVETNEDFLDIYDGTTLLFNGTGSVLAQNEFDSSVGNFHIEFNTGALVGDIGWEIEFSTNCDDPVFSNTTITSPSMFTRGLGDVVGVSCDTGSELVQEQHLNAMQVDIQCTSTGWNVTQIPNCERKCCGTPNLIDNGYVESSTGTQFGDNVTYSCYNGFSLTDSGIVLCQDDGTWAAAPNCTVQPCSAITSIGNGSIVRDIAGPGDLSDDTSQGAILNVTCDPGYQIDGSPRLLCTGGDWSHEIPTCLPLLCPIPFIENGAIEDSSSSVPISIAFTEGVYVICDDGYSIVGSSVLTCNETQLFTEMLPECADEDECLASADDCDPAGSVCINTPGGFMCECLEGFRSLNPMECNDFVDIDECNEIPGLCDHTCVNTTGSYYCECDLGYVLWSENGTQGFYIEADQLFNSIPYETGLEVNDTFHINHTCVPIKCPLDSFGPFDNGTIMSSQDVFHYGDAVSFFCDLGYTLSGVDNITCTEDGSWTASQPTCQVAICTVPTLGSFDPPIIENGVTNVAYGEFLNFTCSNYLPAEIRFSRECVFDQFTGNYAILMEDILECPVVDCGTLPTIGAADTITLTRAGDTYYDNSFSLNCLTGFTLDGSNDGGNASSIKCLADGHWDLGDFACIGAQCPDPGTPLNGYQVIDTTYEVNSLVYYECNRTGWAPSNADPLECQLTGTNSDWNSTVPVCEDVEPPVIHGCPNDTLVVDRLSYFTNPMDSISYSDNTGLDYQTAPNTSPRFLFPEMVLTADMDVEVSAQDYAGETTTCTINIIIRDDIIPVLTCPEPLDVVVDLGNSTSFYPSDLNPADASDATDANVDRTSVIYTPAVLELSESDLFQYFLLNAAVTDEHGNSADCDFLVHVTAGICDTFALPAPLNGSKSCSTSGSETTCTMTCDAMEDGTPRFMVDINNDGAISASIDYTCTAPSIDWPTLMVPACIDPVIPLYSFGITYKYSYVNDTVFDQETCGDNYTSYIEDNIRSTALTGFNAVCTANVYQDTEPVTFDLEMNHKSFLYTWNDTTDTDMSVHLRWEVGPGTLWQRTLQLCGETIARLVERPSDNPHVQGFDTLIFSNCPTQNLHTTEDGVIENPDEGFNCKFGYTQFYHTDGIYYCLPCSFGTYYSINTLNTVECYNCPEGQYNDQVHQSECKTCPAGTGTLINGTVSIDGCIDMCDSYGMFSGTSLPPCTRCLSNTYMLNASYCEACPDGSSTRGPVGGVTIDDCYEECGIGEFSHDGYAPCNPCPASFYQNLTAQTTCTACTTGFITLNSNSMQESDCIDGVAYYCNVSNPYCSPYTETCSLATGFSTERYPVCDCDNGFTGEQCNDIVDFCSSNPCNVGECTNLGDSAECQEGWEGEYWNCTVGYTCDCPSGFSGDSCEVDPDNCASLTCGNNGVCHDMLDSAVCICPSGYTGTTCDEGTAPCSPDPCNGNGECTEYGTVRYECICDDGWEGLQCETNIDECASDPCLYSGVCVDGVNSYTCTCETGYTPDSSCEMRVSGCDSSPCVAEASCVDDYRMNGDYYCVCSPGFRLEPVDQTCSQIDFCMSDPCENGGDCALAATMDDYECTCVSGFVGKSCQTNIDACTSLPCLNGGECEDLSGDEFMCQCVEGWTGAVCDVDIDECTDVAYMDTFGNGTLMCNNFDGNFTLDCLPGYEGALCEMDIDECFSLPCQHDSECIDVVDDYLCLCTAGWTGSDCDTLIDQCTFSNCTGGSDCYSIFDTYYCACNGQTYGQNCELEESICRDANPCLGTGSTCSEDMNGIASCECGTPFMGECCGYTRDFCAGDSVCVTGTCQASGGTFECICDNDYTGVYCEMSQDDCVNVNCGSDGVCVDGIETYYCDCPMFMTGPMCDKAVDEDYDLYCFGENGVNRAYSSFPFVLNTTSFSLSLWVKYADYLGRGPILTLYGMNDRYITSPKDELLRIDDSHVFASFGEDDLNTTYTDTWNNDYDINLGVWVNLVVVYDSSTMELKVWYNNLETGTIMGYGSGAPLMEFGYIELASYTDPDTGVVTDFNGYISSVHLYNRVLTPSELIANLQQTAPSGGEVLLWQNYLIAAGCQFLSPSTTSISAGGSTEPPPTLPSFDTCPDHTVQFSMVRQTEGNWTVPTSSYSMVSSYTLGHLFSWGVYYQTYKIQDNDGNSALCQFPIYVNKFVCEEPDTPSANAPNECSSPSGDLPSRGCMATCNSNESLAGTVMPNFYTCDALGSFNPMISYSNSFRMPSCAPARKSRYNYRYTAYYNLENCEAILATNGIAIQVIPRITALNALYTEAGGAAAFCSSDCNSDIILVTSCGSSDVGITVTYSFMNISREIIDASDNTAGRRRRALNDNTADSQDVLNFQVFQNDLLELINTLVPDGALDIANIQVDAEQACDMGEVPTDDGMCVQCAVGTFHNLTSNQCELCDYGFYQDMPGATSCQMCPMGPIGTSTELTGSTSILDCYRGCPPGTFVNTTDCADCDLGFYQPDYDQYQCIPCPADKTTALFGSTLDTDCLNACISSGSELASNGSCVDCPRGQYRDAAIDDFCVVCPDSNFTTAGTGSGSVADCSVPYCMPGTYIDGDECTDCDVGFYQPDELQDSCDECATNFTTVSMASDSMYDCVPFCSDGQEYNSDFDTCDPCPIGYHKSNAVDGDLSMCTMCPSEFITAYEGAVLVAECDIANCTAGQMLNTTTNLCEDCPIGSYSDDKWLEMCTECPLQFSTTNPGTSSAGDCLLFCDAGFETNGNVCVECDIGYFKDEAGLSPCSMCSDNMITPTIGSTMNTSCNVEDCGPGYYSDGTAYSICMECQIGYYQFDFRQMECIQCPTSYTTFFNASMNMTDCVLDCSDGQEYNYVDACDPCPLATYRTRGVDLFCLPCPVEFITADVGAIDISECNIGNCSMGEQLIPGNTSYCELCPRGTYQPYMYGEVCLNCSEGLTTEFNGNTDSDDCITDCADGQELDIDEVCQPCAIGFYRSAADGLYCQECITDYVTTGFGAINASECFIRDCGPGTFINDVDQCEACPTGFEQPDSWQYECIDIDECSTSTCSEFATCNNNPGSYNCTCNANYNGDGVTCLHTCDAGYCLNGAQCVRDEVTDQASCVCTDYYSDERCSTRTYPESQTWKLIAGVIGGVIGVIVVIFIFLWICWCCRATDERTAAKLQSTFIPQGPPVHTMVLPPHYAPQYASSIPIYEPFPGMVRHNTLMGGPLANTMGRTMTIPEPSLAGYGSMPRGQDYMFYEDTEDKAPTMQRNGTALYDNHIAKRT